MIVDAERGLVLTNHHVIKDAESRNLRTRIAAPQELAQVDGQAVPQLPGMRMAETVPRPSIMCPGPSPGPGPGSARCFCA